VAGNMTRNVTPTVQAYTYDEENRLSGAAGYTYTYDGDGNRVRKSNGNLAANGTLYWYMTPGVVAESDLAGTLKSEYVFFDGERVARRDGPTGTGGVFYYFSDHLKTASVITDSAGVIKAESDYYPWGGELQFVNNDSNDYKFTGKKRDLETGLDYFGARYYSNGLGRWVSADWSSTPVPVPYADFGDPQSLNLYSYVRGLPTTRFDADGHCCWDEIKSYLVGAAKELHNWGADQAAHGIPVLPAVGGLDGRLPLAPAIGESTGLTGMGTDRGAEPVIESPSNGMETAGMVTMKVAPVVLAVVGARAGVEDPEPAPYNRAEHYGNPSSSEAAQQIRANGEGQPCSSCGETMQSGTKTAPTAEHQPTLKQHYYEKGGHKMTPAERRAYAKSSQSMQKDAVCKTCQSKQGAAEAKKQYQPQ
jgi:RHS repeat-associated protein